MLNTILLHAAVVEVPAHHITVVAVVLVLHTTVVLPTAAPVHLTVADRPAEEATASVHHRLRLAQMRKDGVLSNLTT